MISKDDLIYIYETYNNDILNFIMRYINNIDVAEDILHDCFEKFIVYSQSNKIQMNKAKSFLLTIAHNLSINYIKRAQNIEFTKIEEGSFSSAMPHDFFNDIAEKELYDNIYKILDSIDPLLKSIYIMHIDMQMTFKDIGKIIGKSPRTVRRKLNNIITLVKERLIEEGFFNEN